MREVKTSVRIVRVILIVLFVILLICNWYFIAVRTLKNKNPTLFGYSTAIVVSGSMTGTINVNDMIIIHHKDSYSCGDIITYQNEGSLVTHRIEEITDAGYITKGDSNNTPDKDPVTEDKIVGSVIMVIPKVGLLVTALKTPIGIFCIVLVGGLLVFLPFQRKDSEQIQEEIDDGENA